MLALAWGLETIKNVQKHVGLAADDDGANEAPHPSEPDDDGAIEAPHPSKQESHVSFQVDEIDGSAQIAATKAKQVKGATPSQVAVLKAEREELAQEKKKTGATITKLGEEVVAARAHGHENDSTVIKALKARLHDLRHCAHEQEQRWTYLEDTIVEPKGYIHINTAPFRFRTPSPEPQRSDKGSSRGRRLSTEDGIIIKGRSLSAEGTGSIARSLSSESSSPTRAAKSPLATRQEGCFRGRMKASSTGDGPGSIARSLSSESASPTRASSPLANSRRSLPKKLVP